MTAYTMKPGKEEEIEDFKKLDALGEAHNIEPIKIAFAQSILIMRNRFRELSKEQFEEFCNQGIEAILPFAGIHLQEPEPEDPNGGWRGMPGWVKKCRREAIDEPEPGFH